MRHDSGALLLLLAGCGGMPPLPPPPQAPPPIVLPPVATAYAPPPPTPDAPFRENPPPPHGTVSWRAPTIATWTMPNGVRVLLVERHELPIVSVRVVSSSGAGDVGLHPAAVAFTASLLEQGAGSRSAPQLSDDLEALGIQHGAGCDWDSCSAHIKALTSRLGPALDILADVVLRPSLHRKRRERVFWIVEQYRNPEQQFHGLYHR